MNPELEFVMETAQRAGELILGYFQRSCQVDHKGNDNPVTAADLAADDFLRRAFRDRFPTDGWLSEETADDEQRLTRNRVWVVDPLDGTKEFVQGLPEFAISIALVEKGKPRLGLVFNPATGELFSAEAGGGTFRNGCPVKVCRRKQLGGAKILASRSEHSAQLFAPLKKSARIQKLGSIAYKLALVAAQQGDLTVSFRPKSEWDVCAGYLLVKEAGGKVTDLGGRRLQFNRSKPRILGLIAANPALHRRALDWALRSKVAAIDSRE